MRVSSTHAYVILLLGFLTLSHSRSAAGTAPDTVLLRSDQLIMLRDSIIAPLKDTLIYIPDSISYRLRKNPYYRSQKFYDSIYYKSRRSAFYRNLYALAFSHSPDMPENRDMVKSDDEFRAYEGKTIASIRILKVDVLEGSVYDTTVRAISGFGRFLNKTHKKTTDRTLEKELLFKTGDPVDPVLMSDNERLLRQLRSIQNARIQLVTLGGDPDKVEVIVIVQDVFPWIVGVDIRDLKNYSLKLEHINMFGLGQELGNKIMLDLDEAPVIGNDAFYKVNNIAGSFINARLNYYNAFSTERFHISMNRAFLTHATKWGGAINLKWIDSYREASENDSSFRIQYIKNSQEYWLGRSFVVGKMSSRQNIILSGLYKREHFHERPQIFQDSNYFYHNRESYLFSIRYSKLQYYKTRLLKSFGKIEDIPAGFTFGLTGGYISSEFFDRPYLGQDIAWSKNIHKLGYLAARLEVGGLLNDNKFTQAAFLGSLRWFSPLKRFRLNKIRFFLDMEYYTTVVNEREKEISFESKIQGLSNDNIDGQSSLVIKHETVMFTPFFFYGFRFAPYLHADVGLISDYSRGLKYASAYYSFGIGIRIRNESLAYSTIVVRLSYLPRTGSGNNILDLHTASSTGDFYNTLELRKPGLVRSQAVNLFD